IRDTGVGIPEEELPRLFERFHQIRGARGRALEGTGIGLALVQELVKLHGGSIRVASTYGRGTTFVVSVPLGSALLAPDPGRPAPPPTRLRLSPYVAEAARWLADSERTAAGPTASLNGREAFDSACQGPGGKQGAGATARVLVVDDNADMRQYLGRLLEGAA